MNAAPTWDETTPVETAATPDAPTWDETDPVSPEKTLRGLAKNMGENAGSMVTDLLPSQKAPLGSIGTVIKEGAFDFPKDLTSSLAQTVGDAVTGEDSGQTPMGKRLQDISESEEVQHPGDWAYKHPIDAAAQVAMPVSAFLPEAASAALPKPAEGPNIIQKGIARGAGALLGPDQEAVMTRLENPEAVKNAVPRGDYLERVTKTMQNMDSMIEEAFDQAKSKLNPDLFNSKGVVPKQELVSTITRLQNELKTSGQVVGKAKQIAFNKLQGFKDSIVAMKDQKMGLFNDRVPETALHDIVKSIDPDIVYDSDVDSVANSKLLQLRHILDNKLKTNNPEYANAMKPLSDMMDLRSDLKRQLGLQKSTGEGLQPSTVTESKIGNLTGKNKTIPQETMERLKATTGEDYLSDLKNTRAKEQFDQTGIRGARRSVAGGFVGHAAAGPLGGALGAIGGMLSDIYGGKVAGAIIDAIASPKFAKYAQAFTGAAKQGPKAVAMTHMLLKEHDPAYAEAVSQEVFSGATP